jgi:pimeloyl-ACP methyl ester carboxylesterase
MKAPAAWLRRLCAGSIIGLGLALLPVGAAAEDATITCSGTAVVLCTGHTTEEESGLTANFKMEKPANWNGTLVLYSHGYSFVDSPLRDVGDPVTGFWLLSHGYALAGSSYARSGWALQQAFEDQIAVLGVFNDTFGRPARTIAWGHSLGGMITAGLIQRNPHRFTAALPMCGVLAGGPGVWNQGLDSEFAFLTLQAPGAFKLVNFTAADLVPNFAAAYTAFNAAKATAQGRARLALSFALGDVPGWFDPTKPEPAATDYTTRVLNQLEWTNATNLGFAVYGRYELEVRAGGNFSWNTGVDYRAQLAHSTQRDEVMALYAAAGLNLDAELNKLNATPRIAANPEAVKYLSKYIAYNGDIDMPVLTLHTTGDGLVEVTDEQAYASVVASAGNSSLLRQTFVHRAGHCTFSPAETITAFQTLVHRIDTGQWSGTDASTMNAQAGALGASGNFIFVGDPVTLFPVAPSFITYTPGQFLRPFDARNLGNEGDSGD